jgi:hypothetical protein
MYIILPFNSALFRKHFAMFHLTYGMSFVGRGAELCANWATVQCSGLYVDQSAIQFTGGTGTVTA